MKKLYPLFIAIIFTGNVFSQGTVVAFTIDPPAPTTTDVVKVYVDLMFTTMGCAVDNQGHSTGGTTTSAYAHHCVGMLSAICTTIDTFNLGMLPAGSHVFDMTLSSGFGGPPCSPGIVPDDQRNTTFMVTTATGIQSGVESQEIELFPNPSTGIFTLACPLWEASDGGINILNILGEIIYSTELISAKTEINLTNFQNGIYFIQIQTEGSTITKKVVKK